jgi:exodeoxyribonuclease V alpha subunit
VSGRASAWELPPLSPRGTARQRLDPAPAYPPALAASLADADLDDGALALAWEVARWAHELPAADRAALLAIVARSLVAVADGSTRMPVDAAERALLARLPELVGAPGDRRPLVLAGQHLYHQKLLASEDHLVAAVRARLGQAAAFATADVARVVDAACAGATPAPSDEQRAAVRAALGQRVAVVTGGPGTGKTTIALVLVRALARLGVAPDAIGLCAPTGKAANRLEQALRGGLGALPAPTAEDLALADGCPPAQTLHRLLGYSPSAGRFQHHENNRLAARAVIVDEASMIDLPLMERLLRALADDALLILIGDADQLPSVRAGAVFRDLAPLGVRLLQSFRMDPRQGAGRRILDAAAAVNAGDAAALAASLDERAGAGDLAFAGVELLPPAAREGLLERWYVERVATAPGLDAVAGRGCALRGGRFTPEDEARLLALYHHQQRFRLLCITRARPTGVVATNAWLHRRRGAGAGAFAPGEPIMMLRNDYDRGLWNGDQGLVLRAHGDGRGGRLVAAFPTRDGLGAFDLDGLGDAIELSYALTVHKAQGSEHDEVALLLPDAPLPLLTREVAYTALTRSRRAVVVCGAPAVLAAAVARPMRRSSGIGEKLADVTPARPPAAG